MGSIEKEFPVIQNTAVAPAGDLKSLDKNERAGSGYGTFTLQSASPPPVDAVRYQLAHGSTASVKRGVGNSEMGERLMSQVETSVRTDLSSRGLGEGTVNEVVASARSIVNHHAPGYGGDFETILGSQRGKKEGLAIAQESELPIGSRISGALRGSIFDELSVPVRAEGALSKIELLESLRGEQRAGVGGTISLSERRDSAISRGELLEALTSEQSEAHLAPRERGKKREELSLEDAYAHHSRSHSVQLNPNTIPMGERYRQIRGQKVS